MKQILKLGVPPMAWEITRPEVYRGYPVRGMVWVCPRCRMLWLMYESPGLYTIHAAPCEDCPEAASEVIRPVPGSLINDWTGLGGIDEDLLDALPLELVKREFELTLTAWEKLWIPKSKAFSLESTSFSKVLPEQGKLTLSEP